MTSRAIDPAGDKVIFEVRPEEPLQMGVEWVDGGWGRWGRLGVGGRASKTLRQAQL